jgi:hypothetical protein
MPFTHPPQNCQRSPPMASIRLSKKLPPAGCTEASSTSRYRGTSEPRFSRRSGGQTQLLPAKRPSRLYDHRRCRCRHVHVARTFPFLSKRALHTPAQARHEHRARHAMSILGNVAPHSESKPARRPAPAVKTVTLRGVRGDIHKASSINGRATTTHRAPAAHPQRSHQRPYRRRGLRLHGRHIDLLSSAPWEQRAFDSVHPTRARARGSKRRGVPARQAVHVWRVLILRARRLQLRCPSPSSPPVPPRRKKQRGNAPLTLKSPSPLPSRVPSSPRCALYLWMKVSAWYESEI